MALPGGSEEAEKEALVKEGGKGGTAIGRNYHRDEESRGLVPQAQVWPPPTSAWAGLLGMHVHKGCALSPEPSASLALAAGGDHLSAGHHIRQSGGGHHAREATPVVNPPASSACALAIAQCLPQPLPVLS